MRNTTSRLGRFVSLLALALVLTLNACTLLGPAPTPTLNVTAIYTSAFQTLAAERATQLALTPPTATPSQTPSPTAPVPATGLTSAVQNTSGTAPAGATGGATLCDSATFASDVTVPDGTVMVPAQNFVKTWAMTNVGTCSWTADYKLVFLSGEAMGRTSTPLTGTVQPRQTSNLSVSLVAPNLPGNYTGSWRLQNASGAYFGDVITVVITVSGSGSAPSPTATP